MPTLIRLIITLLFLAGLVYAGMFALVAFVEPTQKEQTIRIPQRDLLSGGQPALPGTQAPAEEPSAEPAAEPTPQPAAEPTTPPEPLTD
jgi:hypothetical protein